MEEINNFAKATLGKLPDIVGLLGKINKELAMEQFRENKTLYLGRTHLEGKALSLVAIAVSAANGQKDSVMLHFNLAKKFGTEPLEVLDALKAAKMALMASTMSSLQETVKIIEENEHISRHTEEVDKIIKKIKVETGMEKLPEGMLALSKFSFGLFMEHLKEKSELLSPYKIDPKLIYLIAYAVSVSIHSDECATTYLRQSMKSGAKIEEIEDALSISRFITGNKAYITSVEVLQEMATKVEV